MATARGTFEITMTPTAAELGGAAGRFDFTKTFTGGLTGSGTGLLISQGDPASGEAGYVAVERVDGTLDGRAGEFGFAQLGTMHGGTQQLNYVIVPGSGSGELTGITGVLELTIEGDGTHHYAIDYELPARA